MLRTVILAASNSSRVERLVETAPVSRDVVKRFVAGSELDDALKTSQQLIDDGLAVTIDRLGEHTGDAGRATATTDAYKQLLDELSAAGLTPAAEVSLKLSAIGQSLDRAMALDNARTICAAAQRAGTTVTFDMEDHSTTDSTLDILAEVRKDFPDTGAVLQAYLRRTEGDCRDLATEGSRVRLCKGAYAEPESVAYQAARDVDRSYVRCLNVLMAGPGHPMIATHDPRLIAIAEERAKWYDRTPDTFEFQMLYGIRPDEQRRLADARYSVRVYLPYGDQWYAYLMRRLAERPANLRLFLRALTSRH